MFELRKRMFKNVPVRENNDNKNKSRDSNETMMSQGKVTMIHVSDLPSSPNQSKNIFSRNVIKAILCVLIKTQFFFFLIILTVTQIFYVTHIWLDFPLLSIVSENLVHKYFHLYG